MHSCSSHSTFQTFHVATKISLIRCITKCDIRRLCPMFNFATASITSCKSTILLFQLSFYESVRILLHDFAVSIPLRRLPCAFASSSSLADQDLSNEGKQYNISIQRARRQAIGGMLASNMCMIPKMWMSTTYHNEQRGVPSLHNLIQPS